MSFDETCNMKVYLFRNNIRQPVPDPHYIIPIKQYRHYLRTFANINKQLQSRRSQKSGGGYMYAWIYK